jgi:hypothetical protein
VTRQRSHGWAGNLRSAASYAYFISPRKQNWPRSKPAVQALGLYPSFDELVPSPGDRKACELPADQWTRLWLCVQRYRKCGSVSRSLRHDQNCLVERSFREFCVVLASPDRAGPTHQRSGGIVQFVSCRVASASHWPRKDARAEGPSFTVIWSETNEMCRLPAPPPTSRQDRHGERSRP